MSATQILLFVYWALALGWVTSFVRFYNAMAAEKCVEPIVVSNYGMWNNAAMVAGVLSVFSYLVYLVLLFNTQA